MTVAKPNVLFFFTDDQRFDTIAALGNQHIHTPNMDRLAARGVTFTHGFIPGGTSGAVCMPSRAMVHTGRTLFRLQGAGAEIPDDHVLLGEHLRRHGYRTFGTGKWHNGARAYARSFTDGAEIFFGGMNDHWNVPACDFDPTGRYEGRSRGCTNFFYSKQTVEYTCDHITPGKHSSELFCDAAIDFLDNYHDDNPFFMYVSFMAPHDPRTMPQRFRDMYRPEALPLPENFLPEHPFDKGDLKIRDELLAPRPRTPEMVREHLADYYAMITHLDNEMGRVLAALERSGHTDNTIIVFAGDNGLALGQHGLFGKQNVYEHSVRVPLIFAGPGAPAGQQTEAMAYLLDIFPTLCDILDIDTPASVEGLTLRPAWADAPTGPRETLYLAYTQYQRAVRDSRYKLIENVVDGVRTTQLFDLETDPGEMRNRAEDSAQGDNLRRLRQLLLRHRDESGDCATEWGREFWAGYDAD